MNHSKVQEYCEQSNISESSIWGIIDLTQSQQAGGKLKQRIRVHNINCPATTITDRLGRQRTYYKGLIQGTQHSLVQELMYLCLNYLETLRRSGSPHDQMLYRLYLQSDRLPLVTNRKQLLDKLKAKGVRVGKTTISNHLQVLQQAGIILEKRNTRRRVIQREDGTAEIQLCEAGRGDFQLFLSKEIFAFKEPFQALASAGMPELDMHVEKPGKAVEKPQRRPISLKNAIIENQSVTSPNRLNLEQTISNSSKTKKYINNKRGKVHAESGVSSRPENHVPEHSSEWKKMERSSSIPKKIPAGRGEKTEAETSAAALNEREIRKQEDLAKFRKLCDGAKKVIPEKQRSFYLKMLQLQYIARLYPDLDRFYLSCIRRDLMRLFLTYFKAMPAEKDQDIFLKLSRAIEMIYEYRQRHPEYKLYDPLSFLRRDYEKGFRRVVEKWVPEEAARLQLRAEKQSQLIVWQRALAYSEDLFKRVIETLQQGLARSSGTFNDAERKLREHLQSLNASPDLQERLQQAFRERFRHFYQELAREAGEKYNSQQDQTWLDFEHYRQLIAEGS